MSRCYGCPLDGPFMHRGEVSVYDQDCEVDEVVLRQGITFEDVFVAALFAIPLFYWVVTPYK